MNVFYDPWRVRALRHRTESAIEAVRRLRSPDPAAVDALVALASLRRTLEDHWIPALDEIEQSDALVAWTSIAQRWPSRPPSSLVPERWLHRAAARARWAALDDGAFIDLLARVDRDSDSTSPPTEAELDALAVHLADRLASDPDLLDALVERADDLPLIGALLARPAVDGDVDGTALVALLAAMTRPNGLVTPTAVERHREAFESIVARLLDDPAVALLALSDRDVLTAIAVWHDLDADLVESLTRIGLYDAVAGDPSLHATGYDVLAEIVELVNGPLDHRGTHPAMALGVAASMVGYVDTLAPAILHEGGADVVVADVADEGGSHRDVRLGTWNDLVDLFGALARVPAAQVALGDVLGGYAADTIDRLGADVATSPGVEPVARFADLVAEGQRAEQAELVMTAAAESADRRRLVGTIGFGATAVMSLAGITAVPRAIASRALTAVGDRLATVAADRLADPRLGQHVYDLIVLGAIDLVARDHDVRREVGLTSIAADRWRALRERMRDVEAAPDADRRARATTRLRRWITAEAPELDHFLGRVRSAPGMDELTQHRNAVAVD